MEESPPPPSASKEDADTLPTNEHPNISYYFDGPMEWLYRHYRTKQKRPGLKCFVIATVLYAVYISLARPHMCVSLIVIPCTIVNLLTFIGAVVFKNGLAKDVLWMSLPHVTMHIANVQIVATLLFLNNDVVIRDILGWVMLYSYLIYIILPFRLLSCFLFSVLTGMIYLGPLIWIRTPKIDYYVDKFKEPAGSLALLVMANIFGFLSYIAEDKQQRTAFLQTKQSLKVKLVIEEQTEEQERLLLSVLPEHVAVQMRQDLDRAESQFKKIYMSRHENVSILYADIVGFTAISSTYSAQELVKMLNELFARFDKLAEKYNQLRIKILGDCYYCISGAPIQRSDHAVLCVHMGLSMVKAIKYVQQTANSPVDMRVGIHTGAVLAGVLGQRQWQFDVYSKDVELANKMESSGMAGKVHISGTTLSFLNGEFEIEPAYGEKRDETLRMAGLKTYFIVKVLKPFEPKNTKPLKETTDVISDGQTVWDDEHSTNKYDTEKSHQNGLSTTILPDPDSCVIMELRTEGDKNLRKVGKPLRDREDSIEFKLRLKNELMNKDGHMDLSANTNSITLTFVDPEKEKCFCDYLKSLWTITSLVYFLVRLTVTIYASIMFPFNLFLFYCFENVVFIVIFLPVFVEEWMSAKNCGCQICRKSMNLRIIFTVVFIMIMAALNYLETVACVEDVLRNYMPEDSSIINANNFYPSTFSYFTILILMGTVFPSCLPYLLKAVLLICTAVGQCVINVFLVGEQLNEEIKHNHWSVAEIDSKYSLTAMLCSICFILTMIARHTEQVTRVLFLWISKLKEQRDCAADLRRRNEALVYNILPPHVAAHFLGNNNRNHEELYSQSYDEVGVLFASMPNFSDFYSEESVNNQGLECLRFLNEVISDFDALLALPKYQDVIKIKTIGSTYMAASGLNPAKEIKPNDPITVRWAHLALLVEFALDLKKALHSINEQSFNHFVLKMGINHGPITAGVIGARKPHYDIWGNTVNVASRMESTGKAGCIQVTEETSQILQSFGYQFEQRGLVAVKGKGDLMTYYLMGKSNGTKTPPTAPVSPDPVPSQPRSPCFEIKVRVNEEIYKRIMRYNNQKVDSDEEDEQIERSCGSVNSKSDKTIIDCSEKVEDDDDVFLLDTEPANDADEEKVELPKDTDEGTALLDSCEN